MSTLRITEIQDRATGKELIFQRAELNLNGAANGNIIRSSKGVSSTFWLAEGVYAVYFQEGIFPDGSYIVSANATSTQAGPDTVISVAYSTAVYDPSTSRNFYFNVQDIGGGDPDPPNYVYLSFYY
jgi:hypothetical protein